MAGEIKNNGIKPTAVIVHAAAILWIHLVREMAARICDTSIALLNATINVKSQSLLEKITAMFCPVRVPNSN